MLSPFQHLLNANKISEKIYSPLTNMLRRILHEKCSRHSQNQITATPFTVPIHQHFMRRDFSFSLIII